MPARGIQRCVGWLVVAALIGTPVAQGGSTSDGPGATSGTHDGPRAPDRYGMKVSPLSVAADVQRPTGSPDGRPAGGDVPRSPGPPDEGRRPPRRDRDAHVPAILIGAAALVAVGSLLASERAATAPAPSAAPDPMVERLLAEGPMLANAFNMSAFAVRGFVRGNWPMLIDFEQRAPGTAVLRVSARDLAEIYTYNLSEACPPPRRCLIQMQLPRQIFGDDLRPAVIAATATDDQGRQTQGDFAVYALGAGPRAIGSVAIDGVSFGPSTIRHAEQQKALYRFYSHSDFSNASVEVWRIERAVDGSRHHLVDDVPIGGVRKDQWIGLNERREWDGTNRDRQVSAGRHKIQVRAWDRVGDWVMSWSDSLVTVEN